MPALFEVTVGSTMWSVDKYSGIVGDVYFKNITITAEEESAPLSLKISNRDGEDKINDIYFENIILNGKKQKIEDLQLNIDPKVKNVAWK